MPNLFEHATSELSQDAFICWLASWADPAYRAGNEALHATATVFLDRLLEVGNGPKLPEYTSVKVIRQKNHVDVLLLVNGDTAIIIEDKTSSTDHSDQLRRDKTAIAKKYPKHRIAAVYFKTGDQCDYQSAEDAGFGCFLRSHFLEVLQQGKASGIKSDIFTDFHSYLQSIEDAVQRFRVVVPAEWESKQWIGLFTELREALRNGDWAHRGHGGGGSWTFRWHKREEKYLRLHKEQLAFCLAVTDAAQQQTKSVEWRRMLMTKNGTSGIRIAAARLKPGKRMTLAVLEGDYRKTNEQGILEFSQTVETLRRAEALMDAALGDS